MKISDKDISTFYRELRLPENSVDRILDLGEAERKTPARGFSWLAIAASIVILFSILGGAYLLQKPSLESQVASAVLKNHFKQSAPTIYSPDFSIIEAALPQFDFAFAPTQVGMLSDWTVLGGRSCSIYSEPAVQINLEDANGQPGSLYVAPLSETLAEVETGLIKQGKHSVRIWQDGGRIFALAR